MTTTPLKFHMAKAKINTLADFKGLRIRYAGEIFAIRSRPSAVAAGRAARRSHGRHGQGHQ